ncbi:GNAT family N-acetyltransferase [Paenibacillus sp. MMS18-CY102]
MKPAFQNRGIGKQLMMAIFILDWVMRNLRKSK